MTVDCFNIKIIDTFSDERSLILEQTQVSSPRLIYNGSEDKYAPLLTSELHFNILVKTSDHAVFLHLFTGSETRFKVQLVDSSDEDNEVVVWQGFLLPEQFNEPYKSQDYFVEFIATDGIGLLKEKYLSTNYYSDKKSIVEILNQGLRLTGLRQSIYLAPVVQNAGFIIDYNDLSVNTSSYIDGDDKMSVYDILVAILESIGCRLFTVNQIWYVVGISQFNDSSISAFRYDINELFEIADTQTVSITREVLKEPFFATPQITMLPPIKKVTVIWDRDLNENLIPEDVVTHYPLYYDTDVDDRTPKYWQNHTDESVLFYNWLIELDDGFDYNQLNVSSYYNGLIALKKQTNKTFGPSIFFNGTVTDVDSFDTNFANLDNSFFVYGSEDLERYATVNIEFFANKALGVTSEQLQDGIDDGDFDNQFYFTITRRDYKNQPDDEAVVYLSNFPTSLVPDGSFDFELSVKDNYLFGKLELEKLAITDDGWYNIKIYPLISNVLLGDYKVYNTLSFTLNIEDEKEMVVDRSIDYTTTYDLDVFHSDSQMNISERRFLFSDDLITSIENGTLLPAQYEVTPVSFSSVAGYNGPALWYYTITVVLEDQDYFNLKNGYSLYVKKTGSEDLVFIELGWYDLIDDASVGGKAIYQLDFVSVDNGEVYIEASDEIYIQLNAGITTTLNYPDHWLDKWKRYNADESISYLEALTRSISDLSYTSGFVFSGEYALLVNPLDIIDFSYNGNKEYLPLNLELNLDQNTTNITMVEMSKTVVDYSNTDAVVDLGDPSLVIEASAVAPSLFIYNWTIETNFDISGFAIASATITATQLDAAIDSGGVPTGLIKTGLLTTFNGVHSFVFPLPTATENGWYEVIVEQNGEQSNKEYVLVDPVVTPPTEYITLTKIDTGDLLNTTGEYSIAFTGFTPGVVTQSLQKIDAITQSPDGLPVTSVIGSPGSDQTITFTESGAYKVKVLADGNESNEIAWMVFII